MRKQRNILTSEKLVRQGVDPFLCTAFAADANKKEKEKKRNIKIALYFIRRPQEEDTIATYRVVRSKRNLFTLPSHRFNFP